MTCCRLHLLCFIMCCASCSVIDHNVYRPNAAIFPGLTENGQSFFSAAAGGDLTGDGTQTVIGGFDVQGAYAMDSHLTLMGQISERSGHNVGYDQKIPGTFFAYDYIDSVNMKYGSATLEAGAMYSVRLNHRVYFTVGLGGGPGWFNLSDGGKFNDTTYHGYLRSRVTQWFLQPALLITCRRSDEIGVGVRLTQSYYGYVATDYSKELQSAFNVSLLAGKTLTMVQTFADFRIHTHEPHLFVDMQFGFNFGEHSPSSQPLVYNWFGVYGNIGFAYRLGLN